MTSSVMMDIAVIAVIVFFGALGWKRGLFRTLSELAAVVLALFLASQISTAAARYVVDEVLRPAAERAVQEQAAAVVLETTRTVRDQAEEILASIPNSFVRKHAQALLGESAGTLEASGEEALLAVCLRLTDRTLNTVVYNLVHSLLYAVCFAVLNFALRLAIRLLNGAFRLPGLRQLNQTGGLLLGAGKGILLAYVCVWLLRRAGVLTAEMTRDSILLRLTAGLPEVMRL